MTRRAFTPSAAFLVTLAVLLALLHAVLALTAVTEKSITVDEIAHLTAGHAYNLRGDYRLQPENGNLPQRWAALPFLAAHAPLPPTDLATWQTADVWNYGHGLFYEQGLASGELLWLGRAMIAVVSAATGLLVFFWSRALFGWRAAFLSLALFAFCPAFLAHGALATSDVMMTFFFVACMGAWWRHLERPGAGGAALSAVLLGLALVTKVSAALLPPMFAVTALVWAAGRAKTEGWPAPCKRLARTTAVHAVVAWAVIWLCYGFRFSAFAPGLAAGASFNQGWGWILTGLGFPARIIWALKEWRVLPEAWLYGVAFVLQFAKARGAFLNGEYGVTGWTGFFPFAFLVKTTLPLLLLLAGGAALAMRRLAAAGRATAAARLRPFTPLAALFAVYWITSLTSHLNIGHRHILPTYPVLFIAAGWLARWIDLRRPLAAAVVLGLTLWHAGESFRVRPHYLAYFNELSGGPADGWRHLVDSSLDWGQDLPGVADWLAQHNSGPARAPVYLAYFGTGDPVYEGIAATRLESLPDFGPSRPWCALTAGIYCVSATILQHVYSDVRGDWTLALEQEYQPLRDLEPAFLDYQNNPRRREELLRMMPAERWTATWKRYETLRFARLCYYLRVRRPEGNAGYSIFIHRLTAAEIAAATAGTLADWRDLIELAAAQSAR